LPPAARRIWWTFTGAEAAGVAAFCGNDDPPLPGVEMTEGEVRRAVRHEQALHLADVLQRRSPLAIRGLLSRPLVSAAAGAMAAELGWTEAQTRDEIDRLLDDLATWHGVTLAPEGAQP
jgi:glycerol-3-phosphate dehydrogenase